MATETQQSTESSQLKLVGKLLGYSLVSKTIGKGRELYVRGKASNPYVTRTLDVVEHGVSAAVVVATPYVSKYDAQIRQLDTAACEKLEAIEKQVPELTSKFIADEARQLSKRVLEEGRNGAYKVYDAKVKSKVDNARHLVDAKYANLLGTLDTYVDYWLPETVEKSNTEESVNASSVENSEDASSERSARMLTNKVTSRVGRLAVRQFGMVRSRSLESLERARGAGTYLLATASSTYEELSKAVRVEFESEKRHAQTADAHEPEHEEPAKTESTPSYGDLQRRLHDSYLLGRAFTKVGSRYTVAFVDDATRRAYESNLAVYAGNTVKLLPVYIPKIRVGIRMPVQPTDPTATDSQSQTSSKASDSPAGTEHANSERRASEHAPSPAEN